MNLVIIVADSLRADVVGYEGGPAHTKTLDDLAKQGVTFEKTLSAAPWTVPSLASMFTGANPHRLGLVKWEQPWPASKTTLFEIAEKSGYEVASFVFDPSHLFRNVPVARVAGSSQDTGALLRWLETPHERPFCLFIHYFWTHIPYVAKPMDGRAWRMATDRVLSAIRINPKTRQGVKNLYAHAVEHFSETWLPQILDRLELEKTWLVITADHGESWGERPEVSRVRDVFDLHGNTLYDEVLSIPLIISEPGRKSGTKIEGLARTIDFLPTFGELLSFSPPLPDIDGVSLARCIKNGDPSPVQEALSAMNADFLKARQLPKDPKDLWNAFALTTKHHKLIWHHKQNQRKLFDLLKDPQETSDLPRKDSPEFEPLWQKLEDELDRSVVGEMPEEQDPEFFERLRQLGYTD